MNFAQVVIREVQGDCSLKILQLFAERIGQTGEPAAMRPQRMILLFDIAGCHQFLYGTSTDAFALRFAHFRGLTACAFF